jgi:hypothetical protein
MSRTILTFGFIEDAGFEVVWPDRGCITASGSLLAS